MPFATRVVPNRTDIQEVIHHNGVKNMLEKAAVSNMIGLLQQLNVLSQHASDVFGGLLEDATSSSKRIASVRQRLSKIEEKVVPTEKIYLENPPSFFYDNPFTGAQWSRKDQLRGFLFRRDKADKMVNNRRERAEGVPNLSALDPFTLDKQPCINKYSDTDFFMNEWIQEQQAKMEEERRKRKLRKEARKKRKKLKRNKTKKIMKVQKKRYNALGAEFTTQQNPNESEFVEARKFDIDDKGLMDTSFTNAPSRNTKTKTPKGPTTTNQPKSRSTNERRPQPTTSVQPNIGNRPQTNQVRMQPKSTNETVPPPNPMQTRPPPNPMQNTGGPPPNPLAKQTSLGAPPPNPMQMGHHPQPSYVQSNSSVGGPPPFSTKHVPTETITDFSGGPMTAQMRVMQSMQLAQQRAEEEERLKKLKEAEYERQKQKASLMMPARSFLSQIATGSSQLKKVDTEKIKREKPKDQRSVLMQSIQKGRNLKKVEIKEREERKEPENATIFAILQRRQLIADSSSEESDSDWGSDEE